jgi:hypothetical protein
MAVQNPLNTANIRALVSTDSRNTGSPRHSGTAEAINRGQPSVTLGWLRGREYRSRIASTSMNTLAVANTLRQPSRAPRYPLNVRATSTPMSSPLMTMPTARPRCAGGAN